jgi:hypothetical protein
MKENPNHRNARRSFIGASAALATAAVAGPAPAQARANGRPRKLRLLAEGDADLAWVLSLYTPPTLPPSLPPGLVIKGRYEYPSPSAPHSRQHDVMSVFIYLSAVVPTGVEPPVLQVISALEVAVESMLVLQADFGADDRPPHNLLLSGRVISNQVVSPFGPLEGRAFSMSCGFMWSGGQAHQATFKMVAGSAAGSHTTVLREAQGYIELPDRGGPR